MTAQLPILKERLEEVVSYDLSEFDDNPGLREEWQFFARALLAAYEQEPVMYAMAGEDLDTEATSTSKSVVDAWVEEWNAVGEPSYKTVPLYTHPAPSIPAVPTEWKLSDAIAFTDKYQPPSEEEAALFAWNACRDGGVL